MRSFQPERVMLGVFGFVAGQHLSMALIAFFSDSRRVDPDSVIIGLFALIIVLKYCAIMELRKRLEEAERWNRRHEMNTDQMLAYLREDDEDEQTGR